MTGKRGPISGGSFGMKPGPEADPQRQARLARPGSKAKVPVKRARTSTEIFHAGNADPPGRIVPGPRYPRSRSRRYRRRSGTCPRPVWVLAVRPELRVLHMGCTAERDLDKRI
jgi:hypothetical protein